MPHLRVASNPRQNSAPKMKAPPHPFPELQGPFEESMLELDRPDENEVPSDAASRRTILLDAPTYERVIAGRWKQRLGEKYHPLWKIVAQLSFGLHLLAENLAKSEEEVTQILQGHIDEIDLFLERTTEDFALAQDDIKERMRCLQLPLQHPKVFDRMLEDKAFRNSIVEGNEKIEHIVARTGCAMRDSLKDAQKGLDATNSLAQYLSSLAHSWNRYNSDHEAVFEAMLENVEGWREAFIELLSHGEKLGQLLKQLTEVINQMQQRAGEVSRRLVRSSHKQGPSPTKSTNVTYVTHQSTSTTGDIRSGTPSQPPRKPLPVVPNRDSARQPSSLGQRCDTAQSVRSAKSHRSSAQHQSRASSREAMHPSARDSNQGRLSTKSPRLVEIKRQSPQGRELAQAGSNIESERRRSDRSSSRLAELSAVPPTNTRRMSPMSEANSLNAGLGIIQSESQVSSTDKLHSPVSAVFAYNNEAMSSSKLPLTPRSMNSNRDSNQALLYELPSESTTQHITAPPSVLSTAAESSLGSPPSTPGWAKQTFDATEQRQLITEKTAFHSHPPNAVPGSPPVLYPTKYDPRAHVQHARLNGSIASSMGAPGPEIASSEIIDSVALGSSGKHGVGGSATGSALLSVSTTSEATSPNHNGGNKTFVAELEGVTPISYRATAHAHEPLRKVAREVAHEVIELDASQDLQLLPSAFEKKTMLSELMASTDVMQYGSDSKQGDSSTASFPDMSHEQISKIEQKMAAAIRKSFIATSIELPGVPVEVGSAEVTADETAAEELVDNVPQGPRKTTNKGVDEIIAQIEQLSSTAPNLELKGEAMLFTLPATTYVPDRPAGLKLGAAPASADVKATAAGSSSNGAQSEQKHTRFRPELPSRNSSESTASSSQSQWRAFFKGQLSPAEFNSSTPHLPGNMNSQHKAIVELQRRGMESSPTLGWQWAPETPEVDAINRKANRYH